MDKKIMVSIQLLMLAMRAPAWTEVETNSVAHALVSVYNQRIADAKNNWLQAGNIIDCGPTEIDLEDLPRFEHVAWPTAESLFDYEVSTNVSTWGEWSPADRRNAFCSFIAGLTNRNWIATSPDILQDAVGALRICCDFAWTNMVSIAHKLMTADAVPMRVRIAATQLYFKVSEDRLERNNIVEGIVTNMHGLPGSGAKEWAMFKDGVYSLLCDLLDAECSANITDCVQEGARMLYLNLATASRAEELDRLLLKVYSSYATSSNRLAVALKGLAGETVDQERAKYFSPITNLLLNATQPLPVVEGL